MTYHPARGVLIVKPVETEESLPGGLIVLTENARKDLAQWQMEVVAVGEPSICEKPKKCQRKHRWEGRDYMLNPYISGHPNPDLEVAPFSEVAVHIGDPRLLPGSWVIVKHRAIVPLSPDTDLYAVRTDDVLGIFQQEAA